MYGLFVVVGSAGLPKTPRRSAVVLFSTSERVEIGRLCHSIGAAVSPPLRPVSANNGNDPPPKFGTTINQRGSIMAESLPNKLETILVVDDTDILGTVVAVLKNANFHVLHANSGPKGLKLAANYAERIDLLLSDLNMQEMSGPELGAALKRSRPDMHVLFIGGDLLLFNYGWAFIQRPFVPVKLLEMINNVLHPADRSCQFISHTAVGT
jgi:CheY-like chemotaxis protein